MDILYTVLHNYTCSNLSSLVLGVISSIFVCGFTKTSNVWLDADPLTNPI